MVVEDLHPRYSLLGTCEGRLPVVGLPSQGLVALALASVEPRANRVHHHRRERDLLIERVLPDALMKIDRQMNRRLAEALAVLRANARLFLRSATTGASCGERRDWRWYELRRAWRALELGFRLARD